MFKLLTLSYFYVDGDGIEIGSKDVVAYIILACIGNTCAIQLASNILG